MVLKVWYIKMIKYIVKLIYQMIFGFIMNKHKNLNWIIKYMMQVQEIL